MTLRPLTRALANAFWQRPMNSSTEIRITRLCTQRCRQCSVYERRTRPPSLSLQAFEHIASELRRYGAYIGFISGGEATLVPELPEMLVVARRTFALETTLVTGLYNTRSVIERVGRVALDLGVNIQTSLDGYGEIGDNLRGVPNFAETVLDRMALLSSLKGDSSSLLYVNIVLNALNLPQVPELVARAQDLGWKVTIGLYHSLTETTRADDELRLKPSPLLHRTLEKLAQNPNILNLPAFLEGIEPFLTSGRNPICPFVDDRFFTTRVTIMENGDVHLCWGGPIGNLFRQSLQDIFQSPAYSRRLAAYRRCSGCWTTCYTQRYLLMHPQNGHQLKQNLQKVLGLKRRS
ncbi:MAG TPA: radical SAM protein [Bacteroidetes bacterium]|nr:radical SAM protein [Bacteroidota bacterium]